MDRGGDVGDRTILQMALVGYQVEKEKVEKRIYELQSLLKGRRSGSPSVGAGTAHSPVKRAMSDAARHRIAAAQRKRWAEHRRRKAREAKAL
jgi:hypothetical protein